MGMDGVELVMAVEEAFDLQIEDAEAEKIRTPRELIDLVGSKVNLATTSICLSHRAFNLSRRSILLFGTTREKIRPTTPLSDLIPRQKRCEFMKRVFQEIGSNEENLLKRPEWLPILLFAISIVAGFVAAIVINPGTVLGTLSTLAGTSAAIVFLGVRLTEGFQTEFPKNMQTVGDFSRWLTGRTPKLADDLRGGWTREQIAVRVREIVIETLGCEKEYREDARFVQDLGMD